jgi:hypothetical protein
LFAAGAALLSLSVAAFIAACFTFKAFGTAALKAS